MLNMSLQVQAYCTTATGSIKSLGNSCCKVFINDIFGLNDCVFGLNDCVFGLNDCVIHGKSN